jgi:hypothetical protein
VTAGVQVGGHRVEGDKVEDGQAGYGAAEVDQF